MSGLTESEVAALMAPTARFSLGCQFASLVIDNFLGGVLLMQVATYFMCQPNDRWITKSVVVWAAVMNIIVTVYYWVYIQYLFVQNYGKWLPWLEVRWLANVPIFNMMTTSVIQAFFAYRAFLLTKRNWFVLIGISVFLLTSAAGAISVKIAFGNESSELEAGNNEIEIYLWLAATTLTDVIISAVILVALLRSRSGWRHTDRTISRLIRLTIESQLLPTFLAVAYLSEYVKTPSSFLGALFQAIQSKCYAVGLLFSLNSRISFDVAGSLVRSGQIYGMTTLDGRAPDMRVEVQTETYVHSDTRQSVKGDEDSLSEIERSKAFSFDRPAYQSTAALNGSEIA